MACRGSLMRSLGGSEHRQQDPACLPVTLSLQTPAGEAGTTRPALAGGGGELGSLRGWGRFWPECLALCVTQSASPTSQGEALPRSPETDMLPFATQWDREEARETGGQCLMACEPLQAQAPADHPCAQQAHLHYPVLSLRLFPPQASGVSLTTLGYG